MRARLRRLRKANPGRPWSCGRRTSAGWGCKPVGAASGPSRAPGRGRAGGRAYEWLYVYGFARPSTGETFAALLPRVNAVLMGEALAEFAAHADPEGSKLLVVLVDNAGWHVARRLAVPPNVVLYLLPACTPELQPAERLWPLLREAVANRTIGGIGYLRRLMRRRLRHLTDSPHEVQPRVGFRWAARLER